MIRSSVVKIFITFPLLIPEWTKLSQEIKIIWEIFLNLFDVNVVQWLIKLDNFVIQLSSTSSVPKICSKSTISLIYFRIPFCRAPLQQNIIYQLASSQIMQSNKQLKSVKVFVRNRPLLETEIGESTCIDISSDKELTIASQPYKEGNDKDKVTFNFDKVFPPEATQKDVYNHISSNIICNIFEGINGTILCYGQTSSGKTYTCLGDYSEGNSSRGIVPRIIKDILKNIDICPKHLDCRMKMSMVEIYNEKIRDLLDNSKNDMKIRQNKSQGIYINGVTEKYILSIDDSEQNITKGMKNRAVGLTHMNLSSSRSHMMITLTVHQHNLYTGEAKAGKIIIVDLAGCQKLCRISSQGKLLEETKKINTSLSVLGKIIKILSIGKQTHVPYRDSKLTRLLQESLGGNCITNLIINISPVAISRNETVLSLRFGLRAKAIKNKPRVNREFTVSELQDLLAKAEKKIKEQTQIIADLLKESDQTNLHRDTIENFIKEYEAERRREKEMMDFKSELGSDDGMKKIKTNPYNIPDNYLFNDINEEEEFPRNLDKLSKDSSSHTHSVTKLFSTTSQCYTPKLKLKKTQSLLSFHKSFQGYESPKRLKRSNSNYGIDENEELFLSFKDKPKYLPKTEDQLSTHHEKYLSNPQQCFNKQIKQQKDNAMTFKTHQMKQENYYGVILDKKSQNICSIEDIHEKKTKIELNGFDLKFCPKIFNFNIYGQKGNSQNLEESILNRDEENFESTSKTSLDKVCHSTFDQECKELCLVSRMEEDEKKSNKQDKCPFENLKRIKRNMQTLAQIGKDKFNQ